MARVILTLEDTSVDGNSAVSFDIQVAPTEFDRGLPPNACPGSVAVILAIRDLWRGGAVIKHAREHLEALLNEAMEDQGLTTIFRETTAPKTEEVGAPA